MDSTGHQAFVVFLISLHIILSFACHLLELESQGVEKGEIWQDEVGENLAYNTLRKEIVAIDSIYTHRVIVATYRLPTAQRTFIVLFMERSLNVDNKNWVPFGQLIATTEGRLSINTSDRYVPRYISMCDPRVFECIDYWGNPKPEDCGDFTMIKHESRDRRKVVCTEPRLRYNRVGLELLKDCENIAMSFNKWYNRWE